MRTTISLTAAIGALALTGCLAISPDCIDIGCNSTLTISYGALVVDEPYELTVELDDETTTVVCLSQDPEMVPPSWLDCSSEGFEITDERAETSTIRVSVRILASDEVVISDVMVPIEDGEEQTGNDPGCGPGCYARTGNVDEAG